MSDGIVALDMNLEDYEDYEPLPPGDYPAQIVQSEMRVSDKGNEYFYIVFQIGTESFPPDYDVANAPEGVKLTFARLQKPTADNRRSITALKNFLRVIGESLRTQEINPGAWEGKTALLKVKPGEWNGQPTNELVSVEALDA